MSELFPIDIRAQIAEVERELRQREHVYPRQVAAGKMTRTRADAHMGAMRAVLDTLRALAATEAPL